MRDLQPYVCTFKDCSFKLFSSRQEWFEHELANHRKIWRCEKCFKSYSSIDVFSDHLDSCYPANLSSKSKDTLLSRSERSVSGITAVECPLCDGGNTSLQKVNNTNDNIVVTTEQFKKHLGNHLEKLALFALPRMQMEDEDENVGSDAALGTHHAHDSWLEEESYDYDYDSIRGLLNRSPSIFAALSAPRAETELDILPVFDQLEIPEGEKAAVSRPDAPERPVEALNRRGRRGVYKCQNCREKKKIVNFPIFLS
jgi:hypothetical protein